MFTGHIKVTRGLAYMFLQICGACFGILLVVGSQLLVAKTLVTPPGLLPGSTGKILNEVLEIGLLTQI